METSKEYSNTDVSKAAQTRTNSLLKCYKRASTALQSSSAHSVFTSYSYYLYRPHYEIIHRYCYSFPRGYRHCEPYAGRKATDLADHLTKHHLPPERFFAQRGRTSHRPSPRRAGNYYLHCFRVMHFSSRRLRRPFTKRSSRRKSYHFVEA